MEEEIILRGYHGTCSKHKQSIEENGLDPDKVNKREDHWLGQGVYFFEDISIAKWWAKDLSGKRYNRGSNPVVYVSDIITDSVHFLNLDIRDELDKFYLFCLEMIDNINESDIEIKPIFTDKKFRGVLFDYYKIEHNIDVIMYTFNKANVPYSCNKSPIERDRIEELSDVLGLEYHEKQICVSNKSCIKNAVGVYGGN